MVAFVVWLGSHRSVPQTWWYGRKQRRGYWCSLQGGTPGTEEPGPRGVTLDEALAWARARTSLVIVRPDWDPSVNYLASVGSPETWRPAPRGQRPRETHDPVGP